MGKKFCQKCWKSTESIFNDYMVEFCFDCYTMRGNHSDYKVLLSFDCIHCGRSLAEYFVGQTICSDCESKDHE